MNEKNKLWAISDRGQIGGLRFTSRNAAYNFAIMLNLNGDDMQRYQVAEVVDQEKASLVISHFDCRLSWR